MRISPTQVRATTVRGSLSGAGSLASGASTSFNIFYGATSSEALAIAALGGVAAEVYSLGQSSGTAGRTTGGPATYIFGFSGVGGTPVPDPRGAPEPALMLLTGIGLAGAAYRRRRKA